MQTLKHIGIIALNTFRESIRDKILYNIGFLAIALTLFSIVLGEWSVFDRAYVIKSTTLSVMSLSGLLISIFVGISLVQKEIQRRTVLTLLSKPISRASFIVGKYFGLLAVVAVHLMLLTAIYYVMPDAQLAYGYLPDFLRDGSGDCGGTPVQQFQQHGAFGTLYAGCLLCRTLERPTFGTGALCYPYGRTEWNVEYAVPEGRRSHSRNFPGALPLQRDYLRGAWCGSPRYVRILE